MSSANLDLVRSILAANERGDYGSVEWAHPEIEFAFPDGPSPGSWQGVTRMAGAFRDFLSTWEDWRVEAEQYRELDGERVLALVRRSGRGKRSGLEVGHVRTQGANLFESAGINRHGEGDASSPHRRSSDPRWPRAVRRPLVRAAAKRR